MSYPGSELKFTPSVTVVSVTNNSSSETSFTFQDRTKSFTIICNEFELLRISWQTGEVGSASGDWFLLYPREDYTEDSCMTGIAKKIYMNAPNAAAAVDVAVIEWQ